MANSIKIGGFSFDALKIGSSDVDAAYLGDTLLYSGGTTPPTPSYKWLATYSDTHIESAQCNSSSISNNEITKTDLVDIVIGDCVTDISFFAFSGATSLENVTFGNSIASLNISAFQNCESLTSIDLPDSVTTIATSAFRDCISLTTVNIGTGITTIDGSSFQSCSSLTSVTINATTPPTLGFMAFESTNYCPIYVPSGSVDTYKAASGWSTYASRIQAIPSPQTLQWVTFSNGDTIPSDLQIYGIKGIVNDLSLVFDLNTDDIYVENAGRNKFNATFGGYTAVCYDESDIVSNTSVEYTFSNVGCSDSYTVGSKTIANMSNDIQLYIYA